MSRVLVFSHPPVRFEYNNRTATAVYIAGTFNEWQPTAKAMHNSGDGHWLKDTVLNPGTYEYCLVADGHWIPDPAAMCQSKRLPRRSGTGHPFLTKDVHQNGYAGLLRAKGVSVELGQKSRKTHPEKPLF